MIGRPLRFFQHNSITDFMWGFVVGFAAAQSGAISVTHENNKHDFYISKEMLGIIVGYGILKISGHANILRGLPNDPLVATLGFVIGFDVG